MFQFLGYNFFSGPDSLNSAPSEVDNITTTRLENAIFDHFNVTRDSNIFGDTIIPDWTYDTILNADFNNNVSAGNLEFLVGQIQSIRVKRRIKGDFNWILLKEIDINSINDLIFTFNDFLNAYGVEYEYAFVPVVGGIEGEYIISSILSKFNGVFIGDSKQVFKFLYDVNYGSNARKQQIGTFEPLGKQYPVIVANGILSYEHGNFTGTIVDDKFDETREYNRVETTKRKNRIKDFLTDKKPKLLKDWNGNMWLVLITSDIQIGYKQGTGMGLPQVQFDWAQIGDANNDQDLYDSGFLGNG